MFKILVLASALMLTSCALITPGSGKFGGGSGLEKLKVTIDSVAERNYKNFKTFRILPSRALSSSSNIEFKRYSRYVANVFKKQGLVQVRGGEELTLYLEYSTKNKSYTEKVHHAGGMGANGMMYAGYTTNHNRKVFLNYIVLRGFGENRAEIFNTTIKSKRKHQISFSIFN